MTEAQLQETKYLAELFQKHDPDKFMRFATNFLHASAKSVREWTEGKSSPRGEKLIRLRVLLDLLDYRVKDFDELAPPVKGLARLIALNLTSMDEALELLDYGAHRHLVFRLLLQGTGVFPQRQYRLEMFVKQSADELASEIERFHQMFHKQFGAEDGGSTVPQPSGSMSAAPSSAPSEPASAPLSKEAEDVAQDMSGAVRLVGYVSDAIRGQDDPEQVRRKALACIGEERLEEAINALQQIRMSDNH